MHPRAFDIDKPQRGILLDPHGPLAELGTHFASQRDLVHPHT